MTDILRVLQFISCISSYLYIASAGDPPIIRYNPRDGSLLSFSQLGSAQSLSFDQFVNVVYWVNFIGGSSHKVMKTMLTGDTVDLNITYPGEIIVTSDMFNLYVLDKENNRTDKYSKTSLEKLGNITRDDDIMELITGYGECQSSLLLHAYQLLSTRSPSPYFDANGLYWLKISYCIHCDPRHYFYIRFVRHAF